MWEISQWIAGGLLVLFGGYVAAMNWTIFYLQLFKKSNSSFAPFMGGLMLMAGFLILPVDGLRAAAGIGLLIDFGCAPLILWTLLYGAWKGVVFLAGKINPFKSEAD